MHCAHLSLKQVSVMGFSAGGAIAPLRAHLPRSSRPPDPCGAHAAWNYGDEIAAGIARRGPTGAMRAAFAARPPATDATFASLVKAIMPSTTTSSTPSRTGASWKT